MSNPNNQNTQEEKIYKQRINSTLETLNPKLQSAFKKALIPHKFDLEIFIPKSMRINKAYNSKKFLRNRLIIFNDDYKVKRIHLDKLKDQTSKFSHQYELVKSEKADAQNNYIEDINEVYKMNGYDIKNNFFKNKENIFEPSVLLSPEKDFNIVCNIETLSNQKKDEKYLERFTQILKDKKTNMNQDENEIEERKKKKEKEKKVNFKFESDDYEKAMNEMKKKLREELRLKNMSVGELRKMNYNLLLGNKVTQNSIKVAEKDYEEKKNKKRFRLIDDIFLSSKGMIRSAKRREDNDNDYDNINNLINIEDDKQRENILYPDDIIFNNDKEKKEYLLKRKKEKLQKVYNNIIKSNFKEEEGEVKGYIKAYTDRKVEKINPKIGSNLRGFLSEFQKKISQCEIPKIAKEVNYAKKDIHRRNIQNENYIPNLKTINYNLINVDKIYDIDKEIKDLSYTYSENLLRLK